jgi:aldehyde:ferredoxin oxidoreductase
MGPIGGYAGRILHVDLSRRHQRVKELSEGEARAYVGGSGLGAKRLWEMTGEEADPLARKCSDLHDGSSYPDKGSAIRSS